MSIINNIDEVRDFYPASVSVDINLVKPYFDDAVDKFIKPYLSTAQYDALIDWINDSKEPNDEALEKLLPYVQKAVIRFAIFISCDQIDLKLTNSGFAVTSNQNLSPASFERVKKFKDSMESSAWDAIEMMLRFLEENKDDYEVWTASDEYTMATRNFVNSAAEFDKVVSIGQSRLTFHRLREVIDQVEYLRIYTAISQDMGEDIISQMKDDDIDEEYQAILPAIKKAVIFFTAAEEFPAKKEQYERMGIHYINDVKKIIDTTPDDYPKYRDSGIYTLDDPTYPNFTNEEDNTIFVMGPKG